jgi:hypothetical protein
MMINRRYHAVHFLNIINNVLLHLPSNLNRHCAMPPLYYTNIEQSKIFGFIAVVGRSRKNFSDHKDVESS